MNCAPTKDQVDPHCFTGKMITPVTGEELIRALAQKLKENASEVGFTIADLEIEGPPIEPFIRETLIHVAEPGTPGD